MTEMMESVVHNTVICNVILTTIIYGSFMSLVRDCLIKKSEKDEEEVTIENGKVEHHEAARFALEREFHEKRCHCLKSCGGRIVEWFRR